MPPEEKPVSLNAVPVERLSVSPGRAGRCASCKVPIRGAYFKPMGADLCPNCAEALRRGQQAPPAHALLAACGPKRWFCCRGRLCGTAASARRSLGVLLWKFKTVVLVVLARGKLLLFGLTGIGTLLSMFAWPGFYWALYGWKFALGIVISIYIHEMGHVQALRRYGIAATAPMFIPGFGAFIRVRGSYLSPLRDARVGLAGPLYGLGAAACALAACFATGAKIRGAIAAFGAVVTMFNLIPVWQLDGSRGLPFADDVTSESCCLAPLSFSGM